MSWSNRTRVQSLTGRLVVATGAALIVLASACEVAGAQTDARPSLSSLRRGDTVRVWAVRPPLSGATALVTRIEGDTLAIGDLPGRRALRTEVAVPVGTLTRLEVQRGYRRSIGWTVTGVLLGVAAGTVAGAFAGVALECGGSCSGQGDLAGLAGFVLGGGLGGLAGGIAGGVIGGQRRSRWEPVVLPPR